MSRNLLSINSLLNFVIVSPPRANGTTKLGVASAVRPSHALTAPIIRYRLDCWGSFYFKFKLEEYFFQSNSKLGFTHTAFFITRKHGWALRAKIKKKGGGSDLICNGKFVWAGVRCHVCEIRVRAEDGFFFFAYPDGKTRSGSYDETNGKPPSGKKRRSWARKKLI